MGKSHQYAISMTEPSSPGKGMKWGLGRRRGSEGLVIIQRVRDLKSFSVNHDDCMNPQT